MNKNLRRSLISYLILFALILGVLYLIQGGNQNVNLEYTETNFAEDMEKGNVAAVYVQQNAEVPTGTVELTMKDRSLIRFYITDVNDFKDLYHQLVEEHNLKVSMEMSDVVRPSILEKLMPYIIGIVGIVIVMMLFAGMQSSGSGGSAMMNFGKSKARMTSEGDNKLTFKDVAGLREEKEDLEEVVDFLRKPGKYMELGARIPKGILLVGPPGTGKTLLAKAVAGEAHVPFFTISGSDFVEMFVGVGASRVRDLFAEAKRNAPCIIFIDEIDAVARRRGSGLGGGHDEREQTLNQMLVEMDGFSVNEGIIVMAATNRVDILDPAILRPGRFDRKITVDRPDVKGREDILKIHTKNKPLSEDVNLPEIARTTAGFAGADLENLMNESAIYAAKDSRKFIIKEDVDKAFIKVGIGTERKSRVVPESERRITAYHEAGHAILFHILEGVGPVYTVSIIPTGRGAAGYTMPLPENDNVFNTKGKILQDIKVSLGGRIAEEMIMDDITTGASQDIKQATAAARAMVVKYGMSEELGLINYETDNEEETFVGRDIGHQRMLGEQTAAAIDKEVKRIIDECYAQARKLLEENVEVLHKCANRLLEKERIDRAEFESLFEKTDAEALKNLGTGEFLNDFSQGEE
ncbi:MAG: ATP-dependent zinc metalloprotease FtsH [Lachnospiraceae bacterium]|nr:ATP-dependent zinc metalloprotease FtsH [Lachnospiraceae bacterium]